MKKLPIKTSCVGVIGAGVIGTGVAHSMAQSGHRTVLVDISTDALDSARANIRGSVRMYKMLQGKALKDRRGGDDSADQILERIQFTTDLEDLAEADFVIENVVEKWSAKAPIYPEIDRICPEHAIFAVNTSCFSITRVAALTERPTHVVGVHFMNPVPLKDCAEVIRGHHTSDATIDAIQELLETIHHEGIVVNDMPGFVSNRVLMLTVNEAIFTVQDQVADAASVDRIFKKCFGHKMGPLETADLIGLDTILYSLEVLHESYADSKYRPSPLLKKMVDAGLHGRKSGEGFYSYATA